MALRRDIAPFLQRVRAFFLSRKHISALRYEDGLADRTQPLPNLPASELRSDCYYYSRDGRYLVSPPIDLVQQELLAGKSSTQRQLFQYPVKFTNGIKYLECEKKYHKYEYEKPVCLICCCFYD